MLLAAELGLNLLLKEYMRENGVGFGNGDLMRFASDKRVCGVLDRAGYAELKTELKLATMHNITLYFVSFM